MNMNPKNKLATENTEKTSAPLSDLCGKDFGF